MTTFIETLNHSGDQFLKFAWPVLWQSSLLIAVIFVLEFALRRKVRAAIRYALWLMVLVKLLLPPSLALPTGPSWWIHPAAPPPVKAPPVSFTVSYGEQMAPDFPLPPSPVIPPPRAPAMSFAAWALAASGVVSAGLLAWLLVRWWQINQKVRRAKTSEELIPVLDEARRLTRLRTGIRLKLTEDSMSPAVCGLFRPVILLPQSLVERLSAGQLRAVLLHEAIHLRRGDVWVNCAQALLQIVYWWHPLLWLANARIRRVREEAVDDAVMLALRDDADIYAPTLLEVAKFAFRRPLASLGLVGILESRSALRQRIERLVDFNAPRKAGLTVVSILGILAFSAVALPMGEAPEKTNAPTPISQPNDNGPTATNVVDSKIEADKLVQNGKLLYEKGNFREAETNFNQASKLDPDNPRAFYYLSLVKEVIYAREEHNGTNSVADSRVQVPNAWSPMVGIGLPVPNPYVTNNNVHTSTGREMIYRKLNSLRLESISWSNGIPLSEALRFLIAQSKLLDPDKTGVNFLFDPRVKQGDAENNLDASNFTMKMVLWNVPLIDVMDAIVILATDSETNRLKYSIEDYGVVFSVKTNGTGLPPLEMRVFKVDTNAFLAAVRDYTNMKVSDAAKTPDLLKFFSAIGMDLTAPGRSVAFNDRLGLLFVKATPSELDTIERVVQVLNQVIPQIHIKARFIEVEQDYNPARGFDWYLGSFSNGPVVANGRGAPSPAVPVSAANPLGSFPGSAAASQVPVAGSNQLLTGILSASNARITLHAFDSKTRSKILAEPECVTVSGRQTQMKATDIFTVLTNVNPLALKPPGVSSNELFLTEQVECGPVFDIVPSVFADGYTLNLTITASVTEFLGYDKPTNSVTVYINGKRQTAPVPVPKLRTQKISTVVNLWDGQTVVLGGSVTSAFQTTKNKVPLLGDLPLVGRLFRSQTENSVEKKLMVFVTATIVDPAGNRVHSDTENLWIETNSQKKFGRSIPPQPQSSPLR